MKTAIKGKEFTKPKPKMTSLDKKLAAERAEFIRKRRDEAFVADLRDDTISAIMGSKSAGDAYSVFKRIEEAGGPTVKTLEAWHSKSVLRPQTPSLRAALRCVGKDLGIVDGIYRRRA